MRNDNDVYAMLKTIENSIWGVVYGNDVVFSSMKLVFLKYAVDNYLGATSAEDIRSYANVQKMFAMRESIDGLGILYPIIELIDRAYGLNDILIRSDVINEYETVLFGRDSKRLKVGASMERFQSILGCLGSVNLEEETGSHELGKVIVDYYIARISSSDMKNMYAAECSSSNELSKLVKGILAVGDNDRFCDFMAGFGFSTLTITNDSQASIRCSEINVDSAALMAMAFIMAGKNDFKISCIDSLQYPEGIENCNKIFVDPPLGFRVNDCYDPGRNIEAYNAALRKVDYYFEKRSGLAVVAVPGAALFQRGRSSDVRERIIEKKRLQAIISLPPLWRSSSVGTNLMVISSEETDRVVVIDASQQSFKQPKKGQPLITDEKIEEIVNVFVNKESIPGFSKVVSVEKIIANDYNISPGVYVEKIKEEPKRSLREIDSELHELYAELSKYFL